MRFMGHVPTRRKRRCANIDRSSGDLRKWAERREFDDILIGLKSLLLHSPGTSVRPVTRSVAHPT